MGWRYRRSVRIFPGVHLNFSKSGVSTSVGVRGAHVTVGHGKVRTTVGIPGSGISYTTSSNTKAPAVATQAPPDRPAAHAWLALGLLAVIAFTGFFCWKALH